MKIKNIIKTVGISLAGLYVAINLIGRGVQSTYYNFNFFTLENEKASLYGDKIEFSKANQFFPVNWKTFYFENGKLAEVYNSSPFSFGKDTNYDGEVDIVSISMGTRFLPDIYKVRREDIPNTYPSVRKKLEKAVENSNKLLKEGEKIGIERGYITYE